MERLCLLLVTNGRRENWVEGAPHVELQASRSFTPFPNAKSPWKIQPVWWASLSLSPPSQRPRPVVFSAFRVRSSCHARYRAPSTQRAPSTSPRVPRRRSPAPERPVNTRVPLSQRALLTFRRYPYCSRPSQILDQCLLLTEDCPFFPPPPIPDGLSHFNESY